MGDTFFHTWNKLGDIFPVSFPVDRAEGIIYLQGSPASIESATTAASGDSILHLAHLRSYLATNRKPNFLRWETNPRSAVTSVYSILGAEGTVEEMEVAKGTKDLFYFFFFYLAIKKITMDT